MGRSRMQCRIIFADDDTYLLRGPWFVMTKQPWRKLLGAERSTCEKSEVRHVWGEVKCP